MRLPDTYDLLLKFERCTSEAEVAAVTLDAASNFGVEYYLSGTMPAAGASSAEQLNHIIGGAWPDAWATRYFQQNYIEKDPTIAYVRGSDSPLVWDQCQIHSKEARKIMREAADFGLARGITLPQCSLDGLKIGISFAGRYMEAENPLAKTALTVIGAYSVASAMRTKRRQIFVKPMLLTAREKEILYWIAEGKTGYEIGLILSVATATIEKHFRKLLNKLGTQNRAHAVAEALRRGLIR